MPITTSEPGGARQMTYGEKAVGLTFNPSGDPQVQKVKELSAQIIDILEDIRLQEPTYTEHEVPSERANLLLVGIRAVQTSQMWAVKAITYK